MEKNLKEYRENGIGFDCNTSELKDLNREFRRNKEIRMFDLDFLNTEIKEIQNKLTEIEKEKENALGIIEKDILKKKLKETNKRINLIVLSLSYKNMNEFISFKLGREISIVYQINQ